MSDKTTTDVACADEKSTIKSLGWATGIGWSLCCCVCMILILLIIIIIMKTSE